MLESSEKWSASNRFVLMIEVTGRGLMVKEGGVEVWDDRSGFKNRPARRGKVGARFWSWKWHCLVIRVVSISKGTKAARGLTTEWVISVCTLRLSLLMPLWGALSLHTGMISVLLEHADMPGVTYTLRRFRPHSALFAILDRHPEVKTSACSPLKPFLFVWGCVYARSDNGMKVWKCFVASDAGFELKMSGCGMWEV